MVLQVVGMQRLEEFGRVLYGDDNPSRIYYQGKGQRVEKVNGSYELRLPLPFTGKGEVDLTKVGDELLVQVGQHRRNLILPRILAGLNTAGARFEARQSYDDFDHD